MVFRESGLDMSWGRGASRGKSAIELDKADGCAQEGVAGFQRSRKGRNSTNA